MLYGIGYTQGVPPLSCRFPPLSGAHAHLAGQTVFNQKYSLCFGYQSLLLSEISRDMDMALRCKRTHRAWQLGASQADFAASFSAARACLEPDLTINSYQFYTLPKSVWQMPHIDMTKSRVSCRISLSLPLSLSRALSRLS